MIFELPIKRGRPLLQAIALFIVFVSWLMAPSVYTFFWSIFIVWWVFQLDLQILAGVTAIFIIATATASAFHAEARVEQLAVYVYFLLVIVIALRVVEFMRGARKESEDKEIETEAQSTRFTPSIERIAQVRRRRLRGVGQEIFSRSMQRSQRI